MPTAHSNSSKHVRRRKIADLSEEQRERKRNTDRQAQQAFRERTKAQIQDLEEEVETMRKNFTENEDAWRAENKRLREQVRRLSHRLEQIRRVANSQLDSMVDLDNDHIMGATHDVRTGAQAAVPQVSMDSPESVIEVESSPRLSSQGPQNGDGPLPFGSANQHEDENQPPPKTVVAGHKTLGDTDVVPSISPPEGRSNQHRATSHIESPHDVLMSTYHVVATSEQPELYSSVPPWIPEPSLPSHSMSPGVIKHSPRYRREVHDVLCEHHRTCPFDHIILDLVDAHRSMLSSGAALDEAIGQVQADVVGLFHPQKAQQSHPLSRVLAEMMQTFAHVELPERAAFMYKIHKTLRWHIAPSRVTYDVLPTWLRPTAKQITTPHAAWIDNIPWPAVRDMLIEQPEKYPFAEFSEVYSLNVTISWPYSEEDIMVDLEGASERGYALQAVLNPIFERHIRNLDNWTVAKAFEDVYPEMREAVSSRH